MQKAVEVICTFDEEANTIRPFRFRMTDETGENVVIQVKRIVDKQEERRMGIQYLIFDCLCRVGDMNKTFQLMYRKDMMKWFLTKVI